VQIVRRRAARRRDHQLAAVLVDQHDRTDRRIERFRHHLGNRLEDAVEVIVLGHGARQPGQGFHAPRRALRSLLQPRLRNRPAHLLANEADERDFVRAVGVARPVMNIDDPDQIAVADQWHRKECFVRVFLKSLIALEPGIGGGVG